MIRMPVDPPGLWRKLYVQWMNRISVGRLDESDGHVVLTPHGTVTWTNRVKTCCKKPRVQPDLAELLNAFSASLPIRLENETVTDNWPKTKTELHRESKWKGLRTLLHSFTKRKIQQDNLQRARGVEKSGVVNRNG